METTPQKIDEARTNAAIAQQLRQSFAGMDMDALEKRALKKHPPVFRRTEPVPSPIRQIQIKVAKLRQPTRKKHVLP